jgi:hypothetical protein
MASINRVAVACSEEEAYLGIRGPGFSYSSCEVASYEGAYVNLAYWGCPKTTVVNGNFDSNDSYINCYHYFYNDGFHCDGILHLLLAGYFELFAQQGT